MAILAARRDPPTYIRNELGDRPSDPAKQKTAPLTSTLAVLFGG